MRAMAQAQMIRQPNSNCRWRVWRVYGPGAAKFAGREVAEHVCDGEFLWIAREAVDGTSWMIDDYSVSLMEVIDHVSPALAEWVIDQTMATLGGLIAGMVGLEVRDEGEFGTRRIEPDDQREQSARAAGLMTEFVQFVNAAGVVVDRLQRLHERLESERTDIRAA